MKHQTLFAVVAVLAGCSVDSKEPGDYALDRNAPRVDIVSPARGTIAGDVTHVLVTGTASDDSGVVASVIVNGIVATIAADGTWSADVPVAPGTTLLLAIASDAEGNQGSQIRAVVAGPMISLDRPIGDSIRGTLSAAALLTLGHHTAEVIETGGLMSAVQGMNPVVDVGGGPDCLYGQASITSLTVGDADMLSAPTAGGIMVSGVLKNVRVGVHLQWAVSCLDGATDAVITADRVNVQGLLAIGVVERKLDIQFANPTVQVTGFHAQLDGVPDTIVQLLGLESAIGPILTSMTERLVVPMVSDMLAPFDTVTTREIAGVQVDIAVEPKQIGFTAQGGMIMLDTSLRARGDRGELVFVPNTTPKLDLAHGFELAVADDAANQLLTSMWSAKAFDTTIDLHAESYEQIGELYDSVQLQLKVPPHVDAHARPLELTLGDWIATFKQGDLVAATVAIHAKTGLYVVEHDDGTLHIAVSTPTVDVDLLDERDWITKAQYDRIKAFASERVSTVSSEALGTIPLPIVGNAMADLWVEPEAGYMLVAGSVE